MLEGKRLATLLIISATFLQIAVATLQGINGYREGLEADGLDVGIDGLGYQSKAIAFRCLRKGQTYKPDNQTTCVCTGFLMANCTKDGGSTTDRPPVSSTTTKPPSINRHPLDPLTSDEIRRTTQIISSTRKRQTPESRFIFNWITLKEPPKSVLLPYFIADRDPPENVYPRKSFSVLIERNTGNTYEAVVNLNTNTVESLTQIEGVQPSLSPEDLVLSESIARADAEVQRRSALAGYPDMSLVNADPWSMGYIGDKPEYQGKRLIQCYLYGKNNKDDNQYAHPFDFIAIVDMNERKVIGFEELPTHEDSDGSNKIGNTVPKRESNYDYRLRDGKFLRTDDKPITVDSPKGASYTIKGNQVEWQKWKMRLGFNGREGLVIHTVNYKDGNQVRPLLYRASLTEMFIPYGDPRAPYHRKAVYDLGEYGIGFNADEQRQNEDAIGAVKFFDGVLNNSTGDAISYKSIISVREEDAGILWKHVDFRTGKGVVVRSHRLVVSFIATVGNYEYIFLWMFYQDGSIQLQIQMSGILSINLLALNATAAGYGNTEFPQMNAQYHQHFFAIRMDTEIDGNLNSVYTSDAVSVPEATGSARNPYGQGFTVNHTDLKTASDARTRIDPLAGRVWIVNNPNSTHPYTGKPAGWKLMPQNTPPLLMKADSPLRPKAAFLDYDVWVTPYAEDQLFPGGFYLNNSGLSEWVGNNPTASVDNTDIVLWHMFGLTHVPRVEDYPVMPVESTGFWFKPYNFFLENPGLDVPPPNANRKKHEL